MMTYKDYYAIENNYIEGYHAEVLPLQWAKINKYDSTHMIYMTESNSPFFDLQLFNKELI